MASSPPSFMHHLKSSRVSVYPPYILYHAPLTVFPSLCAPSLYPLSCTSHSLPESLCTLPISSIMHLSQSSRVSVYPPYILYHAPLTVFPSLCAPSLYPLSCTSQSSQVSVYPPYILYHAPLTVFTSLCVPALYPLSCTSHSLPESPELTVILGAWGIRSSHGD